MKRERFRVGDRLRQALAQAKAEDVPIREIVIERTRVRLIVGNSSTVDEALDAEAKMEASMRAHNGAREN